MRRVITPERNGPRACCQLSLVIAHTFRRVELVARAGEMQHVNIRVAICRTRFPVAGNAATYPHNSAQTIGVRKGEAIVERARLREAEQENTFRIGEAFAS